ncbi:MAG: hypothetical protein KAJ86_02075 [Alphaproteobacteria bacterium]|nr:hypothetical protein [Alphaproteobacteria bacterium]
MRRTVIKLITEKLYLLYGSLFLLPFLNLQAAIASDGHTDVSVEHHESSGGLPQLNPESFPSQIFWLVLIFFVMYFVFLKKVLPGISSAIENRQESIQRDINAAEDLKLESEKVHQAYDDELEKSRSKASELFIKAENKVKIEATAAIDAFRERSNKESQEARLQIAKASKNVMKDIDQIAAEVANQATEKLVGLSIDVEQIKSVIDNINKKAA